MAPSAWLGAPAAADRPRGNKSMRIVIIGASGMLGRHCVHAALDAGHEVVATARNVASLEDLAGLGVTVRNADLDDQTSLRAYYPTLPRPWRDEVAHARGQMETFYAACAERPLQKIVYLGAAIALPKRADGEPANEMSDHAAEPKDKNPYLQVKWVLDRLARAKAADGLPVVVGIPTMSFGEYDVGRSTGRLVLEMANGTLPGYIEGKRNVLYAGDAGRGLVRCAAAGAPGQRYLLAGENLTVTELMEKIAIATGRPLPKRIPLTAAKMVSAIQGFKYDRLGGPVPTISSSAIAVMASGQFIDGSKAVAELGFQPRTSVDESIGRALQWLVARGLVEPT
jgi:dihydroflavonol-4-reductase